MALYSLYPLWPRLYTPWGHPPTFIPSGEALYPLWPPTYPPYSQLHIPPTVSYIYPIAGTSSKLPDPNPAHHQVEYEGRRHAAEDKAFQSFCRGPPRDYWSKLTRLALGSGSGLGSGLGLAPPKDYWSKTSKPEPEPQRGYT